jgi:hypothetical protein
MQAHAEWVVETEAAHRLRLHGWYERSATKPAAARLASVRSAHLDVRRAAGDGSDLA